MTGFELIFLCDLQRNMNRISTGEDDECITAILACIDADDGSPLTSHHPGPPCLAPAFRDFPRFPEVAVKFLMACCAGTIY
jgi:hypothetical protein